MKQAAKKQPHLPLDFSQPKDLETFDLKTVLAYRQDLEKQMKDIKARLTFSNSEPLHDYYMDLMRKDMLLLCRLSDILMPL